MPDISTPIKMILFKTLIFAMLLMATVNCFSQQSVVVNSIKANLRGTPNMQGLVVSTVQQGEEFELITVKGPWYLVQTPNYVGWLHGNAIRLSDSSGSDEQMPTETRRPQTTSKPPSTDASPFQSEYVGGDSTSIVLINKAGLTLSLNFGGVRYIVEPGGTRTIEANGGAYEYYASAPGVRPKSGVKQFNAGYRYSWTFWVVTSR